MGIYLNPDNKRFQKALNSPIYVDKTEMVMYLNTLVNTEHMYVCVSRPRRFGKSMAVNMLSAYYGRGTESRALFERTKLSGHEGWDRYLSKYDLIRVTMTDFIKKDRTVEDSLILLTERILDELDEQYPGTKYDSSDFVYSLNKFYQKSKLQLVIVIDEWDAVFRERKNDKKGQEKYLDFLRDWLKDQDYVALAYVTGILPIKKYGKHSALNMFTEYSMMAPRQLALYTGFTEKEVKALTLIYGMNYNQIQDWYDGYQVSDSVPVDKRKEYRAGTYHDHRFSIYSPLSVVESMTSGVIRNYWNKTETYEALAEYIRKDYDGLKEAVALLMDGGRIAIDTSTYQNDMTTFTGRDDILSLLVHLGYLGYDDQNSQVFIPNREILNEFRTSTKGNEWSDTFKSFDTSLKLLEATWNGDEETVARLVEYAHDQASNKTYNNEAALNYGIQLAYYAARKYYTTILELDSGKGYADVAYLPAPAYPDKPALLIELKYGHSIDAAMDQVRKRKYLDRFDHYKDNTLVIGINYNNEYRADHPEFKHHSCRIEKY